MVNSNPAYCSLHILHHNRKRPLPLLYKNSPYTPPAPLPFPSPKSHSPTYRENPSSSSTLLRLNTTSANPHTSHTSKTNTTLQWPRPRLHQTGQAGKPGDPEKTPSTARHWPVGAHTRPFYVHVRLQRRQKSYSRRAIPSSSRP